MSDELCEQYFTSTIARDLHDIILGNKLGIGASRDVYVLKIDPTKVVKIEANSSAGYGFQNIKEFITWQELTETKWRHYLAECFSISSYGSCLIMERTYPVPEKYKWPVKMPKFLTDLKKQNFGLTAKGKLVAHDYGTNLSVSNLSCAMRKADWWSAE